MLPTNRQKITSFTDLNTWKEGHKIVICVYERVASFPKEERYGLSDQMKRAAVSITSNIAEGFSRQSNKEKLQFYYMAKGSLTELQNQALICRDVGLITQSNFESVANQTIIVSKLLAGLIKSLKP